MLIKIHRGTPVHEDEAMCDTCRHSHIVRGRKLQEEIVLCGGLGMEPVQITFKVTSCSDYIDNREPSYHELLEKAWILRPATKRRPAGFVPAAELNAEQMRRFWADPTESD